jgi:fatty-acyl-CoA synthase
VPAPGAQPKEDELLAYARSRLASFKVPKQIHVMADFPKNPTGKVLKRELRQRFAANEAEEARADIRSGSGAAR